MACRLIACVLLLLGLAGQARAGRIDYRVDLGVERNDNLLLTSTDPIATTILRPGIGFMAMHESSTWQTEFSGRAEYLDYGDDRFDSAYEGDLNGRLNWVIAPERVSFALEDSLSMQPVNTLLPNAPGNRQRVNVVSLGPTVTFRLGETLQGAADLRYIDSQAEVTDEFNSNRVSLGLRAVKQLGPTSQLSANVQHQQVDFDIDLVGRDYTRTDLYARYSQTLASIDYALDAGYSQISYRRGGGDRREPLLRAQASWRSGDRHLLTLRASSQFSDTASDALADIEPGNVIPGSITTGQTVVNASPYRERGLELRYTFTTPRLTGTFAPYYNRMRYVDTDDFDQNMHGARADVNWHARQRLNLGINGAVGRTTYVRLDRRDEIREVGGYVDYAWTRHLSARLAVVRQQRNLSVMGQDATQNAMFLTLSYRNR